MAYETYQENATKLLSWIAANDRVKEQLKQNLVDTDYALKQGHDQKLVFREPKLSDFHKPSVKQKQGEMIYLWGIALVLGVAASRFL